MRKYKEMTELEGLFYYTFGIIAFGLSYSHYSTHLYILLVVYLLSIKLIVTKVKTYIFNKKSKVISIEDTEFLITNAFKYNLKKAAFKYIYCLDLKSVEDETFCPRLESKTLYKMYHTEKNITLQKVVYKYKNKYICDFKFAEKNEYKKLKELSEDDLKEYELIGKDLVEKYCNEVYRNDFSIKELLYWFLFITTVLCLNSLINYLTNML